VFLVVFVDPPPVDGVGEEHVIGRQREARSTQVTQAGALGEDRHSGSGGAAQRGPPHAAPNCERGCCRRPAREPGTGRASQKQEPTAHAKVFFLAGPLKRQKKQRRWRGRGKMELWSGGEEKTIFLLEQVPQRVRRGKGV
jgi:hypothetical protein